MINSIKKPEHLGDRLRAFIKQNGIKVAEVAEVFNVARPSVYDWMNYGRMDKIHYGKLVQWSKLPIEYWLDIPVQNFSQQSDNQVSDQKAIYMTPRLRSLIELFEAVTKADQDEIMRSLAEKKQGYEALISELLSKRA